MTHSLHPSSDSIAWLKRHLGALVEPVPVEGDKPLLLDDPSCAYLTLSEHHQLFCVAYRDGKPEGRREHLAACGPGQLIFGLQPRAAGGATALLLSGTSGSVVWRLPMAALLELGQGPEGSEGPRVLAELFDRWIELLIAALPPAPVPARSRALTPGEWPAETGEQPLCSAGGIVWIAPPEPPWAYRGVDLNALGSSADAWPLSEQAWVLCKPGEFRVWSTEQLLRASGRAEFALGFSAFVAAVATARRAQFARQRLQRDEASRRDEQQRTAAALAGLAQIGSARPGRETTALEAVGTRPFELACQRIFRALGLDPSPAVRAPEGSGLHDMQLGLDRIHGLRTRAVVLEGDWQRTDGGPMLGFRIDGEDADVLHPVALLPRRGGYDCYDPREGTTVALDPAGVESLHPRAHQFYRSFPDRPLTPLGVLRFAAHGVRPDIVRIVSIGLAAGLLGTALPLLTGQVYDRIIPGAERDLLWQLIAVLGAVFLGSWLFDLARGLLLVRAQTRMDSTLEAGVWDRLLSLPLPFFRQFTAGDLAARAEGIGSIREVLANVGLSSLLSGMFSIWNLALLFYYDAKLALAAVGLVTIAGAVATLATYYELGFSRASAALDGKLSGLSLQLLGGIGKLRSAGAENRAFAVWARSFARRREIELQAGRIDVRVAVFQSMYPLACSMMLYWLVAREQAERLSTGQFLAFSVAFATFMLAVLDLVGAALQTVRIVPLYERAGPILKRAGESRGAGDVRTVLKGAIELSHVSFRYQPDAPLVLDDLTLEIEPGEFVAVVGPSGSGKSTLLRLLLGFDAPSEGGVYYDGQALSGLDVRALRQQIGVVLQHSQIMAGDIYGNIVGSSGRSLEEAWRAARQAAFDRDIEAMPMGMHTVIAQGGGTLSGGQRQRLLIARALASQPRVLLFDEATSALDNQTQAAVSASLDQLRVTRVVIAHRLSTIQHADRIIVLDRGRIVQQGRYEQLLAQGGMFGTLARRQLT